MQSEVLENIAADMDAAAPALPDGEYAIVEMMGHRKIVGRVTEIEKFGTKYMGIEPVFQGALMPMCLVGGGSIFQFTPCTAEVARKYGPQESYQLCGSLQAIVPGTLLEHHADDDEDDEDGDPTDFRPEFLR